MVAHYRKVSATQRAIEDADRARKIRAGRIEVNAKALRLFQMRGLQRVWELVHGGPMPAPNLELEPSRFTEWLMMDECELGNGCRLETAYKCWYAKYRDYERRRSRAYRLTQSKRASRRRMAKMLLAIPRWADRQAIRALYAECRALNDAAGCIAFHVDHYYPLQGKSVTGLHVIENLRIIPARENLRKSARMPVD